MQVTFPRPMFCNHIYTDGKEERVRYGQYEAIQIIETNGWPIDTVTLIVPLYLITEVTKSDGTKVVFEEPFLMTNISTYKDGRPALKRF